MTYARLSSQSTRLCQRKKKAAENNHHWHCGCSNRRPEQSSNTIQALWSWLRQKPFCTTTKSGLNPRPIVISRIHTSEQPFEVGSGGAPASANNYLQLSVCILVQKRPKGVAACKYGVVKEIRRCRQQDLVPPSIWIQVMVFTPNKAHRKESCSEFPQGALCRGP